MADSYVKLVEKAALDYDLVIFGAPCQSMLAKLISGPMDCKAADCIPISTLIARCPRWPLKEILLVTRGQLMDNVAVDWAIRLAQASAANIYVLVIVPPMPAMCHQSLRAYSQMGAWLDTDTMLGWHVERLTHQLMNWDADKRLRFREGEPDWQIQQEVKEENYNWALWHLLNDTKTFPRKSATIRHIDLATLETPPADPEVKPAKETIPTCQIYIPPMTVSGPSDHTGTSISGMGGSWRPVNKLVPKRRHHWRKDPLRKEGP
jgi:hypothetical protein